MVYVVYDYNIVERQINKQIFYASLFTGYVYFMRIQNIWGSLEFS